MYSYRRRNRIGPGSIFLIVVFSSTIIGLAYLAYLDKGKFWDVLPIVGIPVCIISLITAIFNMVRKTGGGYIFLLFFLIFLTGTVLSSVFGPFAMFREAERDFEAKRYQESIQSYKVILDNYPGSRYANPSLANISFACYQSGRYEEAVTYLKKSIQENLVSPSELEIEKILADCYFKLGQDYYKKREYLMSAESYLNGVEALRSIRANHPDSNEAFIANYKIPEYMLEAALAYKSLKSWDQAIKVLEEITSDYSESEFSVRASSLLFDIYVEKSMNLKESYKYRESIREFLKVLELGERNKDTCMFDYYSKKIFEGVDLSLLETVGEEMQLRKEYEKALFVYDKILKFYPESKEEIIPNIVECKVEIISTSAHTEISQPESGQKIYSPEKTRVIIKNETEYNLVVYFKGPELKLVELKPKAGVEVELLSGTYKVAAELTGENGESIDILPFYGVIKYEENQRYREVYSV